jgi:hypothetical protein
MHLNRRCHQSLRRNLGVLVTSRTDGRRFRRINHLAEACRALALVLRQSKKMARADPHLFGPHARRYYLDTIQAAQQEVEAEAALRKVYGPPQPGDPPPAPGIWTRRYSLDPQRKGFRKWFREQYGS